MHPEEIYYSEKQRFRQLWIWLLVLISLVALIWTLIQQIILALPFDDHSVGTSTLVICGLIFGIGFPLFMYITGLDTKVRESGVAIRFWPFHRKWIVFRFEGIQKAKACSYSPLKDYGGWGIRYGRKGKAYNVSGDKGVCLTMGDGKNVLIGSKTPDALCLAMNERLSARSMCSCHQ